VEIGFIAFHKLKPYYVKKLNDFNSCCCKYHQEMMEIKVGFYNMKASNVHQGYDVPFCTCGCEAICANPGHGIAIGPIVSCQALKHTY
jgi:hypothetical protein